MNKIFYIISCLIIFVLGLSIISFTSINGLHAKIPQTEFYVPPNKDIYECRLQWIHENHNEQFLLNHERLLTCVYKCKDTHGTFRWYEKSCDKKGCKIKTRVYKTELG